MTEGGLSLELSNRIVALLLCLLAGCTQPPGLPSRRTQVAIRGDAFLINGTPTYAGRSWNGMKIEGLLLNSRMVQATFDDLNTDTISSWAYPDTKTWDPDRNTAEFVASMPQWRRHGLLAITLNFQGGNPRGYAAEQPWHNSAFREDGTLRPEYLTRLARVLTRADELGMAVILGLFYFGQDKRLRDEGAVRAAIDHALDWITENGYRNVLIEINNECNIRYGHRILQADHVHELILSARRRGFLAGASFAGGTIPTENVVRASDFLLLHGNGVKDPSKLAEMVRKARAVPGYRTMPILFNEDDHFDFDRPLNNMVAAIGEYCGWGYYDPGQNDYSDGYQSPPVQWTINTPRKKAFFDLVKVVTGE